MASPLGGPPSLATIEERGEEAMNVHLTLLGHAAGLQENLLRDGWKVEPQLDSSLTISHPKAPDEQAARNRLDRLGLLISPAVRIGFGLPSPGMQSR
jgi:hypothetical protein